ncbi:CBS domain-containing protein [Caballeronia sp. LZ065]|uniref:CBS domain-containing protein n=1 Tax=Caballeronia sp. LZ065 TaxID=3038571 RepID=UPI002864916A|nr:CBS domain-containing protein [Caballeronia sp. LZ065]MDR5781205.1 CBS domain-containing protein [Caballeronia sp. LZ065]
MNRLNDGRRSGAVIGSNVEQRHSECFLVGSPTRIVEEEVTTIREVMTRDPVTISPMERIRQAAKIMGELNVGVLPVCDGKKLVGMLTDRDIVLKGVSAGIGIESSVEYLLSEAPRWCYGDEDAIEVRERMAREQTRRLPVVDREMRFVGVVALGDIAIDDDAATLSTRKAGSTPSGDDL